MTTTAAPEKNWLYRFFLGFVCRVFRIEDEGDTPNFIEKAVGGLLLAWILLIATAVVVAVVGSIWESIEFSRLSPAEHLAKAKTACGGYSDHCADPKEAIRQLEGIPPAAPESTESSQLLSKLHAQITADAENAGARAREQMQRNFDGSANDPFNCAMSTNKEPIVSFDGKQTWWKDDGRCATRLQKKRDEDAQLSSYWSTTLRVDTDMNSSWLPDEERTCQTYPDSKGKISTVRCTTNEGTVHNIPVTFWGGVERNTISNWKCSREKNLLADHFVCKAID